MRWCASDAFLWLQDQQQTSYVQPGPSSVLFLTGWHFTIGLSLSSVLWIVNIL